MSFAPADAIEPVSVTEPVQADKKHPIAVFFHLFWKAAAIILYLCLSFFVDNYVVTVVVVLLILAADFWTVKNVTGRLLARMRYISFVPLVISTLISYIFRSIKGIGIALTKMGLQNGNSKWAREERM